MDVQILGSYNVQAIAAEAKRFVTQFKGVLVEVRSALKEFHDRFIVVDQRMCMHVGASIKDAGKTAFMISVIEDEVNRLALIAAIDVAWKTATPVT